MTCESIKMEISANPEYVGIIRLTTSGIANKIGFSIDDIEDMKVAVSEACTNAIKHSSDDRFYITFNILDDGLTSSIKVCIINIPNPFSFGFSKSGFPNKSILQPTPLSLISILSPSSNILKIME